MTASTGQRITPRRPTMSDVARAAGVSQTTVSFVVNDVADGRIPEPTRKRVWAEVRRLGYRPNVTARQLRTNQSQTIGFVTDGLAAALFAGDLMLGAQEAAWASDRLLTIATTDGDPRSEAAALETLLARQVDGIVFASVARRVVAPPAGLRELPAVLLNCVCADRSLPAVVADDVAGGHAATELLLRKGHRRVGFIDVVQAPTSVVGSGRLEGYRQALATFYVGCDDALVRIGDGFAANGYRATYELMQRSYPPTALICGTDRLAMGVYDALRELRLVVARDVAVVGFAQQAAIATSLRPSLSTLDLPFAEMGRWAARFLTDHLDRTLPLPAVQHAIACAFVERAST